MHAYAPDRTGLVERLPTFLYVLLMAGVACVGAVVFGIAAVVVMLILHIEKEPFSTLLFVASGLFGLACGILIVRRLRRPSAAAASAGFPNRASEVAHPFGEDKSPAPPEGPREWYYLASSGKQGPIPEAELRHLVAQKRISRETHVWRKGLIDWIPLSQADIQDFDEPPPVSHAVGNGPAWVMAFLPLIFAIADAVLIQANIDQQNASGSWFIVVPKDAGLPLISCVGLTLLLTVLDLNSLYKAGYRPTRLLFGLLFTPVYLFMRAGLLKQIPYQGFVWLVCMGIVILAG